MTGRYPAVAGGVLRITGPKDSHGCKASVQVKLNGGTITLVPTCVLQDTALLSDADGDGIEYNRPSASTVKLNANISAAGIYEFFLDGKTLILTVSAVTGTPDIYFSVVPV